MEKPRTRTVLFASIALVCAIAMGAVAIHWTSTGKIPSQQMASKTAESIDAAPSSGSSEHPGSAPASPQDNGVAIAEDEGIGPHEAQTVLIQIPEGTTLEQLQEMLADISFVDKEDINEGDLAMGFVALHITDNTPVRDAIDALASIPGIEGAQPNFIYTAAESIFDEYPINDEAAISLNGDDGFWQLESVNAFEAWSLLGYDKTHAQNPIGIAVIDTGVNPNHYDLKDQIVARFNSYNAGEELGDLDNVNDVLGHGTHVAGIAAATANNGICIAGISYNSKLVAIKANITNTSGNEVESFKTSTLARGYTWLLSSDEGESVTRAQKYNIRIVNISIGGAHDVATLADDALFSQIRAAKDAGILTVCAAGNRDASPDPFPYKILPSDDAEVLSVINLDHELPNTYFGWEANDASGKYYVERNFTSNYNEPGVTEDDTTYTKDISAPGTGILSTSKYDARYISDETQGYGNNKSEKKSGTSMATPLVSGIAALMFAAADSAGKTLTPDEAISIIESTAHDLGDAGWDAETGYGEIDAAAAVKSVLGIYITGSRCVGANEAQGAQQYAVEGPAANAGANWQWTSSNTDVATINADGGLTPHAAGKTTITATDGTSSASMEVAVLDPAITSENPRALDYVMSEAPATYTVSGANTETYIWQWSVSDGTASSGISERASIGEFSGELTVDAGGLTAPASLIVTATCSANENISVSREISVVPDGEIVITFPELEKREGGGYHTAYTGTQIRPQPVVTLGSATLTEGEDYSITYGANRNAGSGTGSITITPVMGYAQEQTITFDIDKRDINDPAVRASVDAQTYTGNALAPTPKVTFNGISLSAGSDFVTGNYSNNKDAGDASVSITGKGNFSGSRSIGFTIAPRSIANASVQIANQAYTGRALTPAAKVTLDGRTLVAGTDYAITYSNNTAPGTATATVTGKKNYTGSKNANFAITAPTPDPTPTPTPAPDPTPTPTPDPAVSTQGMYRLYNPNSGEHFYTASSSERSTLSNLGWVYEGIGWHAPKSSSTPVYRLYNPNAGDHHYTMSVSERDMLVAVGWNYEGIGWYSDDERRVPLYRQYNPNAIAGSHNYTINIEENDMLVTAGWNAEGIGWFGV